MTRLEKSNENIIGVIWAGGYGTRMNSSITKIPKPLTVIKNKNRIIDEVIKELIKFGCNEIYILTGYLHKEFCEIYSKNKFKAKIIYTGEDSGTAERLLKAESVLKNKKIILTYGDSIVKHEVISKWEENTSSVYAKKIDYGVIKKIKRNKVEYLEKPEILINAGFYKVKYDKIKKYLINKKSFEVEVLPEYIKNNNWKILKAKEWFPIDSKNDLEKYKSLK